MARKVVEEKNILFTSDPLLFFCGQIASQIVSIVLHQTGSLNIYYYIYDTFRFIS